MGSVSETNKLIIRSPAPTIDTAHTTTKSPARVYDGICISQIPSPTSTTQVIRPTQSCGTARVGIEFLLLATPLTPATGTPSAKTKTPIPRSKKLQTIFTTSASTSPTAPSADQSELKPECRLAISGVTNKKRVRSPIRYQVAVPIAQIVKINTCF